MRGRLRPASLSLLTLCALGLLATACASGRQPATPATAVSPGSDPASAPGEPPVQAAEPAAEAPPAAAATPAPSGPPPESSLDDVYAAAAAAGVEPSPYGQYAEAVAPAPPPADVPVGTGQIAAAGAVEPPVYQQVPQKHRLRDICRQEQEASGILDQSRQFLAETFCGATLWLDGLFGGTPDVANARSVAGRVELATRYSEYDGTDFKGRLRLEYELPNLERRLRLFLGREPDEQFIADRQEGLAIRSELFELDDEERWLAGLGYSRPGPWMSKMDFRVGGRLSSAPEVFVQGRFRHNIFMGDRAVIRMRNTAFWENREGWGDTASIDYDRVLRDDILVRFGNVATWSESTLGVSWRTNLVSYMNLLKGRAMGAELFIRGATDSTVPIREYGGWVIYRQPLRSRYLYGHVVAGYTFPQKESDLERQGSGLIGLGIEMVFGGEDGTVPVIDDRARGTRGTTPGTGGG